MHYTKEMLEVMEAFEQGQPIQARCKLLDEQSWRDVTNPYWVWNLFDYRIKPTSEE